MNYYQVLGIPPHASDDDIKKSFKKLAVKYHPDKSKKKEHHDLFIQINEAYETLKSPESRVAYDRANGFLKSRGATTGGAFSAAFSGFSKFPSYYDMFRLAHHEEDPIREKMRREREQAEATLAAKLAKQKADMEVKRKREEERKLQELRERQMREQQAKEVRMRECEKYLREKKEREELKRRKEMEHKLAEQRERERLEQRAAQQMLNSDFSGSGDETNPIVVEDEVQSPLKTPPEMSSPGASSNLSYESATSTTKRSDDPEVTLKKLEELLNQGLGPGRRPDRGRRWTGSVSPTRKAQPANVPSTPYTPLGQAKRAKRETGYEFSDLRLALGPDRLDDLEFDDLLHNLPKTEGGNRKISHEDKRAKRTKFAEYSDGSSRADTLYTPVNKATYRPRKVITIKELGGVSGIGEVVPPQPPANPDITKLKATWGAYDKNIKAYATKFLHYKQAVIQYQYDRSRKDMEYHEIITSDNECFETYQKCLEQDLKVAELFTQALRIYSATMQMYKQNSTWMQMTH